MTKAPPQFGNRLLTNGVHYFVRRRAHEDRLYDTNEHGQGGGAGLRTRPRADEASTTASRGRLTPITTPLPWSSRITTGDEVFYSKGPPESAIQRALRRRSHTTYFVRLDGTVQDDPL